MRKRPWSDTSYDVARLFHCTRSMRDGSKEIEELMSEEKYGADKELREKHNIEFQPFPTNRGLPSAHDLVAETLDLHIEAADTSLSDIYDVMLEMFADLCKKANLDPVEIMKSRKAFGMEKYGTTLQAHNGRNQIKDAIDEIADGLVYVNCGLEEGIK